MKQFLFSLEGVLDAKRTQEEAAEAALALLQNKRDRVDARIGHLERLRFERDRGLSEELAAGASPARAIATLSYTARLGEQIAIERERLDEIVNDIREQREKQVALMKERKCFEALRERQLTAHRRAVLRKQYEAIDDAIIAQQKEAAHG